MRQRIPEGSKVLGVSARTTQRRIKDGDWPCYKLGPRSIWIDPDEILKLSHTAPHGEQDPPGDRLEG